MENACEKLRHAHVTALQQSSSSAAQRQLRQMRAEFRETIASVNSKINRFNMIAPTVRQQRVHYNADKECQRIADECTKSSTQTSYETSHIRRDSSAQNEAVDRTTLKDVLKEIKALFHKGS
jgi:hypothetical protein